MPAIIDQTGWILALLGLFPWLFDHYLFNIYSNEGIIDSVLMGMLGIGALLIFIMGGREAGGIGGKVGLGAYACYGIVNLLGDVLSYSRLFALALSSAIIASVINDIAGMLSASIPVLGFILAFWCSWRAMFQYRNGGAERVHTHRKASVRGVLR